MSTPNNNATHDIKHRIVIRYPSEYLGGTPASYEVAPVQTIRGVETRIQSIIDSLEEAHIGIATAEGAYTGTLVLLESSKQLPLTTELWWKNLYFDIIIEQLDEDDAGTEWKVEQKLLIGCKMSRRSWGYVYGRPSLRTIDFVYLRVGDRESDGEKVYLFSGGSGKYDVSVSAQDTTASDSTRDDLVSSAGQS